MNQLPKAVLSSKGARIVRASAVMVAVGILVQMVTLNWDHPTAFLIFAGVGGLLVVAGIIGFFWSRFV